MSKSVINSERAPAAIGTYSQAIRAGNTIYLSGQIPLDPETMTLVEDSKLKRHKCLKTSKQSQVPPTVH